MTIRTLAERYIVPEDVSPDVQQIFQQQHQLIYEAISDKDEASARIRMQDHLQFLIGSIGKLLHSREP
jgi:DNA-binding FadR family transcriptional regulator